MPARRLQVGDRVVVYGGYDMDPAWLAASPNGYSGEVVEFIPGQDSEPAAVIALDAELVLPEGAGAVRGKEVRGRYVVLELGHVGDSWSTPTPRGTCGALRRAAGVDTLAGPTARGMG